MAKRKKKAKAAGPEKRRNLRTEFVASPWGNGFDKITRVVDTIEVMRRRKQLDIRQYEAALKFRLAYETTAGALRSSLGFFDQPTSPTGPRTPSSPLLSAAEALREARKVLGILDALVVEMVAGQGLTIEQTAVRMCPKGEDGRLSDVDIRVIGRRLRDGLEVLALRWFGPDKKRRHDAWTPEWARPEVITRWGHIDKPQAVPARDSDRSPPP